MERRTFLKLAALVPGLALAGCGGSANAELRARALEWQGKYDIYFPNLKYCTDNAAMIAMAGYYRYLRGDFSSLDVSPVARLEEL